MKCEKCQKNEATVLYREIINGKETKANLCPACAREKEEESGLSFQNMFSSSFFPGIFAPKKQVEDVAKCPLCASTVSFIRREGKVGCPACYSTFSSFLEPTLNRLHGGASHRGRSPIKYRKKLEQKNELENLEKELKAAIEHEEYENAALLRDKIREMRKAGEN